MIRFQHAIVLSLAAALAAGSIAHADNRREIRLSLADAVALSLKNNPELAIAGVAPRIAAADVKQERGVFDPILSLFAGLDRDKTPLGLAGLGSFRNGYTAEARLSGRLALGTEYDLRYGTTRVTTDSPAAPFSPASSGFAELAIRQPLLRGFGSVNEAGITIARGNERIAKLGLHRESEQTVATTVDAYWRLVRAHKSLAVARESLALAEQLVQRTQTRVAAGDLPTIELTQARASVAARQEAVILGEAEVGNANDALARLLVIDPREVFSVTLVPTEEPTVAAVSAPDLDETFRRRADVRAARQAVTNAEVALAAARNLRRPDLSAVGSVAVGGLASQWHNAQRELALEVADQHRFTAGLVFTVPLGNRGAEGAYDKAHLVVARAKLALRSLELQVTEEVRSAQRNLEASIRRVDATQRATELAREQLVAGEKRLATGLSTAFEVLRLQTDLAAAQNAEIAAMTGYRAGAMRVQLATGSLLGR